MGEVLKARDPHLNRFIAIKVLPHPAAADPERRQRFEREAKAIAALNHPHIVTIHSVEEADGLVFLTMELVEGRSLAEALSTGGLSLDRLLKIAIPVADAIAAAHQKGITHRDLKPANIMVGEGEHEGRIKVLDFGLVKLTERGGTPTDGTTMPGACMTGEGRIVGTVAYMSPEQAEGRIVDPRSDVFSLGIVLYEMATGQRPFTGTTSISLISSILKDTPKSVTEVNPMLPRDLGRIVRRALAKDLDHRYQTAKDLRNDLEELRASLDSGELTQTASSDVGEVKPPRRTMVMTVAAAAVVLGLGSGLYWMMQRPQSQSAASTWLSLPDLQLVQLTTSGNAERPVISPDGRYVAYVQSGPTGATGSSAWIRQVATSSNVQIVPPEPGVVLQGLTVTPDGNFVDYIRQDGLNSELWRVSFLGGTPKKLLVDVRTPIGWSPDGRRLAFVREDLHRGRSELVVADADGGNRRVLAARQSPAVFDSLWHVSRPSVRPAWSMDGRVIAVAGSLRGGRFEPQIVFVDATAGTEKIVAVPGAIVQGLDWLDHQSLIVNQAPELGPPAQLWRLTYPSGIVTRLTNDLTSYVGVSLTAARDGLVTARADHRLTIWVGDGAGASGKDVVSTVPSSGRNVGIAWAGDRLLFASSLGGQRAITSVRPGAGTPQEVASQAMSPMAAGDGRTILFLSTDPARPGLWKTTDGGRPVLVTPVATNFPSVTRDGRHVVFTSSQFGIQSPWMISIDGGTPIQIAERFAAGASLSPDGKTVAFGSRDDRGSPVFITCDLPDCSSPRSVTFPSGAGGVRRWTPDGKGITYVAGVPSNLWVQPVDGKRARQLTRFTDSREVVDLAWSHDGTRLAIARVLTTNDIVLFKGLRK